VSGRRRRRRRRRSRRKRRREGAIAAGWHLRSILVPRSLLFRLSFASRDLQHPTSGAFRLRLNLKMIANRSRRDESILLADAAGARNGDLIAVRRAKMRSER